MDEEKPEIIEESEPKMDTEKAVNGLAELLEKATRNDSEGSMNWLAELFEKTLRNVAKGPVNVEGDDNAPLRQTGQKGYVTQYTCQHGTNNGVSGMSVGEPLSGIVPSQGPGPSTAAPNQQVGAMQQTPINPAMMSVQQQRCEPPTGGLQTNQLVQQQPCHNKEGDPHEMERRGLNLGAGGGGGDSNGASAGLSPQESRRISILSCIQTLMHTSQCLQCHSKSCKRKVNNGCPICKQLIALCVYHAKYCEEAKCTVPYCENIKQRMRQQRVRALLSRAHILNRRIAAMQNRAGSSQGPSSPQQVLALLKANPQIMAAFIKRQQSDAQQNPPNQQGGAGQERM